MIIHYDSSIEISGGRLLRKAATKIYQLRYLVEKCQEKKPLRFFIRDIWWKTGGRLSEDCRETATSNSNNGLQIGSMRSLCPERASGQRTRCKSLQYKFLYHK